jgi:hypothetical protein
MKGVGMKGMHVVALGMAVAATAAGATAAVGQGTGATVGPKAVGPSSSRSA